MSRVKGAENGSAAIQSTYATALAHLPLESLRQGEELAKLYARLELVRAVGDEANCHPHAEGRHEQLTPIRNSSQCMSKPAAILGRECWLHEFSAQIPRESGRAQQRDCEEGFAKYSRVIAAQQPADAMLPAYGAGMSKVFRASECKAITGAHTVAQLVSGQFVTHARWFTSVC